MKNNPLAASLKIKAESHWTSSKPSFWQNRLLPTGSPLGWVRWKVNPCLSLCLCLFAHMRSLSTSKEDRLPWQDHGMRGYIWTMMKSSSSLLLKGPCACDRRELPVLTSPHFLSWGSQRAWAHYTASHSPHLSVKMTFKSNLQSVGFFQPPFLKVSALELRGIRGETQDCPARGGSPPGECHSPQPQAGSACLTEANSLAVVTVPSCKHRPLFHPEKRCRTRR